MHVGYRLRNPLLEAASQLSVSVFFVINDTDMAAVQNFKQYWYFGELKVYELIIVGIVTLILLSNSSLN